jgi:pimeloyl-ACP methyl ester carboxylesterase
VRHLAYPFCKSLPFLRFVTRNFTYAKRPEEADILAVASGTFASLSRPLEALKRADLTARLGEIRCPTLVIGCEEDMVVRPEQARFAAERIPGARLQMLEGCGHLAMIECPEEFNGRLVRFLRDHRLNLVGRRPPQW